MAELKTELLDTPSNTKIGVITLDAPVRLNALNEAMVVAMYQVLKTWQEDPSITLVWLQGAGERGFCAGGDVKGLQQAIAKKGAEVALPKVQAFFENEYRLDYLLHTYAKPVVIWGQGVVMGGGIGLLVSGSHRIVTETARLAMPEITIGLYPDVGGTYFLSRMPDNCGLFAGLTGAVFNSDDALYLGLADYCLPESLREDVLNGLASQSWQQDPDRNKDQLTQYFSELATNSAVVMPTGQFRSHAEAIKQVTTGVDLIQICDQLARWQPSDPWLQKALVTFKRGCPTTAHLVYWQCTQGRSLSLAQAFQAELILSLQCALHQDFPEGVRALLVDKDQQPKWQFNSVAEVPASVLQEHLQSPWQEEGNPLDDLTAL